MGRQWQSGTEVGTEERWGGRYKDRQGNGTQAHGGSTETRGGSDREMGWRKPGGRAQEGTEGRETAGRRGLMARGKARRKRGDGEEVGDVGTLKTNLRYSGNWGHRNLQRKQTKKTMGQEQSSGTLFWSPGSAVQH